MPGQKQAALAGSDESQAHVAKRRCTQQSKLSGAGSSSPTDFANRSANSPGDGQASVEYRYSPLSEQGSIRLLRLMPHQDQEADIQCTLFEYPLQRQTEGIHPYEALSYVWGSEDNQQPVYIHSNDTGNNYCNAGPKPGLDYHSCPSASSRRLLVTGNLYTALSHLRYKFIERIIWIDAICIDQTNNDEKGQQVQSMAKIYAKAKTVIVWLGEAADNSDQALRVIGKAAEEQHTNLPLNKATQQATLMLPAQQPANSTAHKANQQAILMLLQRQWFQRIWVGSR